MHVEHAPVTGREDKATLSPQMRALSDFYQALNERDITLMARNWAPTDDVVMDNPVGGIKRGWDEIRAVYERVFASGRRYWFEFHDYSYHEIRDAFYVVGRERGEFESAGTTLAMAIRTTRLFRLVNGAWRQVHHHGSIDEPALLDAYQRAVGVRT